MMPRTGRRTWRRSGGVGLVLWLALAVVLAAAPAAFARHDPYDGRGPVAPYAPYTPAAEPYETGPVIHESDLEPYETGPVIHKSDLAPYAPYTPALEPYVTGPVIHGSDLAPYAPYTAVPARLWSGSVTAVDAEEMRLMRAHRKFAPYTPAAEPYESGPVIHESDLEPYESGPVIHESDLAK